MAATDRGHTRWGLTVPFLAVPVLVLGFLVPGLFMWAPDDRHDPDAGAAQQDVCAEALAFGGARAPAGADLRDCTVQRGIDTAYSAVLLMPREDVAGWLRSAYPHAPRPRTGGGSCGALCLDVTHQDGLPASARAHVVQVRVEDGNAETARVRFSAFTM
ncbi:hypothetical protein ACPXCS_05625 [Streptomyces sp. DT190]|jgi:hypothetical protein|uniref:hypothetical protein n=1 Tax=unclassified Streptomyces TaxID=2593676 RepID=UPI003CF62633